jgi:Tfp pilus assembly pilus retraction ATPase PilT
LIGVQSQILAKSKDGSTRVGVFELLLNTHSIKTNIKKKDVDQIDSIIETSNMI